MPMFVSIAERRMWERDRVELVHLSDAQFVEHGNQSLVKSLVGADTLGERYIDNIVVAIAYHDVALPLHNSLYSTDTRAAGQDAVAG